MPRSCLRDDQTVCSDPSYVLSANEQIDKWLYSVLLNITLFSMCAGECMCVHMHTISI